MDLGQAPPAGTILLLVVTAIIGASITLLFTVVGKRFLDALLEMFLRPFRFVKEKLYRWIAPRNPFSISLRSYRKHVSRSYLTRIENPVGPDLEVPLEHAFAPLKLISSNTNENIDLFMYAANSYRFIVLGGPGTGKTTLMKSIVTSIINKRAHENLNDLIPVFVVLRHLAKSQHSVEQAIVSAFASFHFPGADAFIKAALDQGKMLIILDGLDEVGTNREFVAGEILSFCSYDDQRQHKNRLIVTCRESSYRTKDLQSEIPSIVRVEPFANHHMRVFLQGWPDYKGRLAIQLYGLIQNDSQIRDICRNPLLLTILTGLYLDANTFKLPTSRDRFYNEAVDELLNKRPARRQIKQNFEPDDKRRILERVALDRLETASRDQDPEEFTIEAIHLRAKEVLHQDKFDLHELIRELVEINGIIKQGSEGNFTCAHRTIQEYFAAREARRTRKVEEVMEHFGSRSELIEVMYFYCGMIENIPDLTFIITTFVKEEKWLEAGRCLLQMKEAIVGPLSEQVAMGLRNLIHPGMEYQPALEVLSSLAQRHEPQYEAARKLFSEAIDYLAEGYGEQNASALESVLATSPEAAMKVIPSLLRHNSQRWKTAAVQLLRDIGTDEALDQLIQLLTDSDSLVRAEAANILAGMIKSRHSDLKVRAALLPPRKDSTIWPLEPYFPGTLAIPIAESLNSTSISNVAIQCAVRAKDASTKLQSRDQRSFLKQWRHVPRDIAIQGTIRRAGRSLRLAGIYSAFGLLTAMIALVLVTSVRNKWLILSMTPPHMHYVESRLMDSVKDKATSIKNTIENRVPPNASGLSRVLPWNWDVEPTLSKDKATEFDKINRWSMVQFDPYELAINSRNLERLSDISSKTAIAELQTDINSVEQNLPRLNGSFYIVVSSRSNPLTMIILTSMFLLFLINIIFRYRSPKTNILKSTPKTRFTNLIMLILNTQVLLMGATIVVVSFEGSRFVLFACMTLLVLVMALGWLCEKLKWPNNPLISTLDDIVPPQRLREQPDEEVLGGKRMVAKI